ncbi:hypothetical protein D0Z07_2506 [Hyphodiscus hymeniophilus]|uniref:Uncharacterized protein n=1 Tax=Hyphodiscus hymeniophilus TaxID=353542 RepID=A0A9P6VNZ0_9HELO|nr:hypothetical protein D0Z07_2506 [Hyphodiscus hymeniophilus]
MDKIFHVFGSVPVHSKAFIITSSVISTLAVIAVGRLALYTRPPRIIPSPRSTLLPKLSISEQADLPYPPDIFPGRDVQSPVTCTPTFRGYGTIRVYEWGPEKGRKVLLVHGISTPCLALGGVANALVEKGCRVMLLDLWGRGYSDSPDLPHDSRLDTAGYYIVPLGMDTRGFQPGWLLSRRRNCSRLRELFPRHGKITGLVGTSRSDTSLSLRMASQINVYNILTCQVRGRDCAATTERRSCSFQCTKIHAENCRSCPIENETGCHGDYSIPKLFCPVSNSLRILYPTNVCRVKTPQKMLRLSVASAVQWQVDFHEGFIRSFVSSIKYASVERKPETLTSWGKLGLRKDKVLIIAGSTDVLIVASELEVDAKDVIGAGNVDWRVIEGGHEFPITCGEEVVERISEIWSL